MKLKLISIATALLMGIVINIKAQTAQLKEPPEYKPLTETKLFSGKLMNWESNQDYFYDGFFLQSRNEMYLVKFSPRLGNQLASALEIGTDISLTGVEMLTSNQRNVIQLVNLRADKSIIYDDDIPTDARISAEAPIYGSGEIVELQKNEFGLIRGIILFDKTILRLTLDAAEQLSKVAIVGTFISYSGSQVLRHGEFGPILYTIVQCRTITIDDKQYLIE